jgi:hypothetical protein
MPGDHRWLRHLHPYVLIARERERAAKRAPAPYFVTVCPRTGDRKCRRRLLFSGAPAECGSAGSQIAENERDVEFRSIRSNPSET